MKLNWICAGVMLMFIASACTKDAFVSDDAGNGKLKSANLKTEPQTVPIKGDLNVILDINSFKKNPPQSSYSPTGGPLEGTISHLGQLKEGSYWKATYFYKHEDVIPNYIDYILEGKAIAANGDELWFSTEGKMYTGGVDGFNWIETMYYNGGTGRFENAKGQVISKGLLFYNGPIPTNVTMTLEGTISNVGQSKK